MKPTVKQLQRALRDGESMSLVVRPHSPLATRCRVVGLSEDGDLVTLEVTGAEEVQVRREDLVDARRTARRFAPLDPATSRLGQIWETLSVVLAPWRR